MAPHYGNIVYELASYVHFSHRPTDTAYRDGTERRV